MSGRENRMSDHGEWIQLLDSDSEYYWLCILCTYASWNVSGNFRVFSLGNGKFPETFQKNLEIGNSCITEFLCTMMGLTNRYPCCTYNWKLGKLKVRKYKLYQGEDRIASRTMTRTSTDGLRAGVEPATFSLPGSYADHYKKCSRSITGGSEVWGDVVVCI